MTNRVMTADELAEYDGAFYGYVLDTEKFESRLYAATAVDSERGFLLYGDLRAAFGIDDSFEPDANGDFGNHVVQRKVRDAIERSPGDFSGVEFDSEGSTFFAYTADRQVAVKLADYISGMVSDQRKVSA